MPLTIIAHGVEHATIDSEVPLLLDHPAIPSSKSRGEIAANISAALNGARRRAVEIKSPQVPNQRISLGHLPTTSGELLGRDSELDTIDRLWASGTNIATVVARGGEGKTALVRHWIHSRVRSGLLADARWVFAWSFDGQGQQATHALDFLGAALSFFDENPKSATEPPDKQATKLVAQLRSQRGLLILDGFEILQAPPGIGEPVGSVRDPSIVYLVKELVAANPGLCLVTTRVPIHELEGSDPSAATIDLSSLTAENGVALLRDLGVRGRDDDLTSVVEQVDGHALSITLSGSYIVEALGGEARSPIRVNLLSEDAGRGGHAWRVLSSYERWLEPAKEQPHLGEAVAQADLLQILRTISVFDRTVRGDRLFALFVKTRIRGLTDRLCGLPDEAFLRGLYKLRDLKLVTLRVNDPDDGLKAEPEVRASLQVDTHPLIREYFYQTCRTLRSRALRKMHRNIVAAVSAEVDAMKINQHWFNMAEFDLPHDPLASMVFMNQALNLKQRHRRYDELVYHSERAGMKSAARQFEKLRDSSKWNGWEHYSVKSRMGRRTLRNELVAFVAIAGVIVIAAVALVLWFLYR
jgi:hypothetical protein